MLKTEKMKKIEQSIKNCKKCNLYLTRKNPVIGNGSIDSEIIFIGEAPGRNEDTQGKPFVGRAGLFFNELLESIGLDRDNIYVTNILKCRPPKNRNPSKNEINECNIFLKEQIKIIKPKLIVTLGNFASKYIFEQYNLKSKKISDIHGKIFQINNNSKILTIIPLYHPAVAIYNSNRKNDLKKDFKKVKKFLEN